MPLFKIFSDWKLVRFFRRAFCCRPYWCCPIISWVKTGRVFAQRVFSRGDCCSARPARRACDSVLLHSYYVPHILPSIFPAGVVAGVREQREEKRTRIAYLVLFPAAQPVKRTGRVRQLLVTFLPLLAAAFLLLLCSDGFRGVTHEEMEAGPVSALRRLVHGGLLPGGQNAVPVRCRRGVCRGRLLSP